MIVIGWQIYLVWLVAVSVLTFILYGYDKAQARKGGWRVKEKALHGLALIGGFPGGWAGRSVFRHKTKKRFFLFVLVISTVIHLGLAYWLFFS
ncbi:DUF1294 domain-containing protein [Chloroflexota bacterium]